MSLKMEVIRTYFRWPEGSFFLFGPRGTGKSTLVSELPDSLRIDLLLPDVFRRYRARPELLMETAEAFNGKRIILDEIQRVPELLTAVHALMDRKQGVQFILTGSSARKLKRTGVDLLAGRAVVRSLSPLMASELGKAFSMDRAIRIGSLPLVWFADDPADTLRSYAALYVKEEVQMEGLVRDVGAFARFLEAASFSHGSVLNVANVSRECQVERKTVAAYFEILRDLLLAFTVPVFSHRAKRELSVHERFYYFDTGLFRSLRPTGHLDRPEEIEGAALEGLVVEHLRAWVDYRNDGHKLHFWRTRSGLEVDAVVYGPAGLWAIEVKNAAVIQPAHLRGLAAFGDEYPDARRILVYRGTERRVVNGILCQPCDEFLMGLKPTDLIGEEKN